jgi:CubicO group peptidase (beta-lactamase class C family)
MKKFLSVVVWFSFVVSVSQAQTIEKEIEQVMKKYQAVGLAVAVVHKNKLVYDHSFGLKNIETKDSLTQNDIFRIASISKSFAATAIMQLVEQGKINLDDDLSNLIGFTVRNPKFPDVPITLRMALSHSSSISDKEGYFSLDAINPAKNPNASNCYTDYKPGTNYLYCNLNFNTIGGIIERISGERYDQYIQKHILQPLGLYGGLYVDGLDSNRFVSLYEYNNQTKSFDLAAEAYNPRRAQFVNYEIGYSTPILSPTGGMKISAVDLAKYMQMHLNYGKANGHRIISKKLSKAMQTPYNKEIGNYGFALLRTDKFIKGVELVGHTGSAYGLSSAMFFDPRQKFGLVLITNGAIGQYDGVSTRLITECAELLYKQFIAQ